MLKAACQAYAVMLSNIHKRRNDTTAAEDYCRKEVPQFLYSFYIAKEVLLLLQKCLYFNCRRGTSHCSSVPVATEEAPLLLQKRRHCYCRRGATVTADEAPLLLRYHYYCSSVTVTTVEAPLLLHKCYCHGRRGATVIAEEVPLSL